MGDENYGYALFFNPLFKQKPQLSGSVIKMFLNSGITRVMDLLNLTKGQSRMSQSLDDQVGIRSVRIVALKAHYSPPL